MRLLRFWKKRGFEETGEPPVRYNGTDYIQMWLQLSPVSPMPDLHEASIGEARRFAESYAEGDR